MDESCKFVQCGKGRCQGSLAHAFGFVCECDSRWSQFHVEDHLIHLRDSDSFPVSSPTHSLPSRASSFIASYQIIYFFPSWTPSFKKLPTYDRKRKRLTSSMGERLEEPRCPMGKLLWVAKEDNERFLFNLKNRIERVWIENPTIEVRFEHLDVNAEVYVGNRGVPTIMNFFLNKLEGLMNFLHILSSRKQSLMILDGISGIFKPSRMTFLQGPLGSGKTTLLMALAGKLDPTLKVSCKVTYNGHKMEEFDPHRTSACISQNDLHTEEMTMRETLAFHTRVESIVTCHGQMAEWIEEELEKILH